MQYAYNSGVAVLFDQVDEQPHLAGEKVGKRRQSIYFKLETLFEANFDVASVK